MHKPLGAARRLSRITIFTLGALTFFSLAPIRCLAATTYYISPSGSDTSAGTQAAPFQTIQKGITTASTGDTMTLAAGTYTGPGNVDIDPAGKSVTVNSVSGPTTTIIDCGGNSLSNPPIIHRAFYIHTNETNFVISGITIKNGNETDNGGAVDIENSSTVRLTNCVLTENSAQYGGAITANGAMGSVTLQNCSLLNNTAFSSGGAINSNIKLTLQNCIIQDNTAYTGGGASFGSGTATVTSCTFNNNTAPSNDGGSIFVLGKATLTNCTITGSSAYNGAGIYNNGYVTLVGCNIDSCIAGNSGGGLLNEAATSFTTATLTQCSISNNSATNNGGGVSNTQRSSLSLNATISINNCVITNNMAATGGGVWTTNGVANLMNCTLTSNTAHNGGAINTNSNATSLKNCTFDNNAAISGNGGGVYNTGTSNYVSLFAKFVNCAFTRNNSSGNGGAVYNNGNMTLQFCSLASNSALGSSAQGGALENDAAAILTDDILFSIWLRLPAK